MLQALNPRYEMTKKILHTLEGQTREFLIPVRDGQAISLVGTKSGRSYEVGQVVYTGTDMSPSLLAEKLRVLKLEVDHELLKQYLEQIPKFKISKLVELDQNASGLVLAEAEFNK